LKNWSQDDRKSEGTGLDLPLRQGQLGPSPVAMSTGLITSPAQQVAIRLADLSVRDTLALLASTPWYGAVFTCELNP
jgi:hypothetical protein